MEIEWLTRAEGDEVAAPMPRASITVALADRHAGLRRSVRHLLDHEDGVTLVAEAIDLQGMIRVVRAYEPAVLLLGLHMPGGSSIDAVARLRELAPGTSTVILAMTDAGAMAQRALESGAYGYVLKQDAADDLPAAIRAAAAGRVFLSPRLATTAVSGVSVRPRPPAPPARGRSRD
jgi:two-component system response regulator NreC